ncbi:MAG TPA: hypothetical protein VMR62_05280 [Bryobacteraceae bacterium]|nr:hypothetical protein [Bryobacteraceae bacterium]
MSWPLRFVRILLLLAAFSSGVYGQSDYTYTIFDFPGAGIQGTVGTGINDANEVVGYYYDSNVYTHGFLWANSSMNTVDFPISQLQTSLYGINNCGVMVGHIFYNDGRSILQSFVRASGKYTLIDYPQSTFTLAGGINNDGTIAGSYEPGSSLNSDGFLWSAGQFRTVSVPGDHNPSVMGINDLGDLVGSYEIGRFPDQTTVAFAYFKKSSTLVTLSYPGASMTQATGINNLGQVVGYYLPTPQSNPGAFLYSDGVYTPVGQFGYGEAAWGINNAGVIVGQLGQPDGGSLGFLATPGTDARRSEASGSRCASQ